MKRTMSSYLCGFRGITVAFLFTAIYFCFPGVPAYALDLHQSEEYVAPIPEDFSDLTWSGSFEKLHNKISREYAFTDWKNIDWEYLYKKTKPKIESAQESNDFTAYYLALKEYLYSIPDGHVRMTSIPEIDNKFIGGGFGFSAVRLSNGKLAVNWWMYPEKLMQRNARRQRSLNGMAVLWRMYLMKFLCFSVLALQQMRTL